MSVLSTTDSEMAEPLEPMEGPGALLRKEREALGWDQAQVAAKLHLSEAMVEALEWDDFKALPSAVFVKGYLKNYARLLGLAEDEILDLYQRVCPEPEQGCLGGTSPGGVKPEVHSSHGLVRMASWLIGIGLIVLLVTWWQGRMSWEVEPIGEPALISEVTQEALEFEPPLSEDQIAMNEQELVPQPDLPAEQVAVFAAETALERIENDATAGVVDTVQESQIEATAGPDPIEPVAAPAVEPAQDMVTSEAISTVPVNEAEDQTTAVTPVSTGRLLFAFNDRCWAEVRDSSGKALILGEIRSGSERSLDASQGPFKIVLGNARAVSLTVNGSSYDLAPHIQGKVARFTLDPGTL